MPDEEYIQIPLGGRGCRRPIDIWAIADAADAQLLAGYTWCPTVPDAARAYAVSYVPNGRRPDGRCSYLHLHMSRFLLGLDYAHLDPRKADHIDGNKLNNRRSNLRIVTVAQNSQNMAAHSDARSRYRGVDWFAPHKKWRARVCISGKVHDLGYFDDELVAAETARAFREANMTHNVETRHPLKPSSAAL